MQAYFFSFLPFQNCANHIGKMKKNSTIITIVNTSKQGGKIQMVKCRFYI